MKLWTESVCGEDRGQIRTFVNMIARLRIPLELYVASCSLLLVTEILQAKIKNYIYICICIPLRFMS